MKMRNILGAGAVLALAISSTLALAADKPELSVGYVDGWSDSVATTNVAAVVIQEKLGYPVKLQAVAAGIMWQGVATGKLDMILSAWLPVTHGEYWAKNKDKVTDYGPNFKDAKIGLIVRAGVENGPMVEALGYRLRMVFVGVFIAGSALAGLGGVMWGLYQEVITAGMGEKMMVLVFIVAIIGGLGSVEGAFIGALLVGLLQNYVAFLEPKLALVSNIALMTAILMWRPQGMLPVVKAK